MIREFSAGIVVYRIYRKAPRYLLLHYEEGHWDFPKGHIEKEENAREAALRETREEAGLRKLALEGKFREKSSYCYKWKKEKEMRFKTVAFFLARETGKEKVKLSYEHIGYRWLGYRDALSQLTFENARAVLKKANRFILNKRL